MHSKNTALFSAHYWVNSGQKANLNPVFGFVHGLKTTQQPSRLQGKGHAYEGLLFYMLFGRHICHLTEAGCVCLWGCFTVSSLLKDSTAKKCPERSLNTHTQKTALSRLWQMLTGALHLFLTPGDTHPSPRLVLHQTDTGHRSNPWYTCHLSSQIKHTPGQWLSNRVTQPHRSLEKWSKLFTSYGPGLFLQYKMTKMCVLNLL